MSNTDLVLNIIQLLVFEEPNIEIYRCVKGDIDLRFASVNITFYNATTQNKVEIDRVHNYGLYIATVSISTRLLTV